MTVFCSVRSRPARVVGAIAGLALACLPTPAIAGVVFNLNGPDGLTAEAEFTLLGPTLLEVRLRNNSTGVPNGFGNDDQLLTGVSWDFGACCSDPGVRITGGTVLIGNASHSVGFDTGEYGPGTDVGGEYGYGNSEGTGLLENFVSCRQPESIPFGGKNLDGPVALNGPQAGLVADPIQVPLGGLGAIQDEIVITVTVDEEMPDLMFLFEYGVRVEFGADAFFITSFGGFEYEPPEKVAALDFPTALAIDDMDGPAPLTGVSTQDLVVTVITETGKPGELVVLLNDGSGVDYEEVPTPVGVDPDDVVVADFDGVDGLDAAVVNNGDDTVTVLLNDGLGEGTFLPGVTIEVGPLPAAIDASDVNGDDTPDLAVANQGDGTVWIFFNDGAGGFGTPNQIVATSDAPTDVSLQPLDKDGFVDLAVITAGVEPTFEVFINDGAGVFFPQEGGSVLLASLPGELGPSDMDNDKDIDYLTTDEEEDSVTLLLNDGNGMFSGETLPVGDGPTSLAIEDLDGDGDEDFLVAAGIGAPGPGGERVVQAFRNELNETGELVFSEVDQLDPDPFLSIVRTATLNSDGLPDIATLDAEDGGAPEGSLGVLLGIVGCPGDLDFTGVVDMDDLNQVLAEWGRCPDPCPPTCGADINGDCHVSNEDLLLILASWGPCD